MQNDAFEQLESALAREGPEVALDWLARCLLEEKNYRGLFELRLLRKRLEFGLPLLYEGSIGDLPEGQRPAYEEAFRAAAREAGHLFLVDGNIPAAWPFFRAIGESAPVAAAIEKVEPGDGVEPVIEIAYLEAVNPYKGFQLLLAHYGTCRAISSFEQYPAREGRDDCARLLVRTVHGELVERLKRAITEVEGQEPGTNSVSELIAGRDWLFGEYSYYVDTSHLVSVIRFSAELDDVETLRLAVELADYGRRLSAHFQYRGEPPFENIPVDYGIYLRALLAEDADVAMEHFRRKILESDPAQTGTAPAQVLIGLLARLGRYTEAVDLSLEHLPGLYSAQLVCPNIFQLCQMAGDFERLREVARERQDLLRFAAGALESYRLANSTDLGVAR